MGSHSPPECSEPNAGRMECSWICHGVMGADGQAINSEVCSGEFPSGEDGGGSD